MTNGAGSLKAEAEIFVELNVGPLGEQDNFLHSGMLTDLFEIGVHHSSSVAVFPVGWIDDDTVDVEDMTTGVMVLGKFFCYMSSAIGKTCTDDESDEIGDAVQKGDKAKMLCDHCSVFHVERGCGLIRRKACSF